MKSTAFNSEPPGPPAAETAGLHRRDRPVLKAAWVFLVGCLAGAIGIYWIDQAEVAQHKREAVEAAAIRGYLLQEQLGRSLAATYALAAVLRQGDGEIENFDALAEEMLDLYGGVSALQLAPAGVIRRIVPLVGNEAALGHDLLSDPERNREAFDALQRRSLTLAGPFLLRQGGEAVVGRLPVFLERKSGEQFWGFVTALVRIPDLLKASGLTGNADNGHRFVLAKQLPEGGSEQVIWRTDEVPLVDPVQFAIAVPNGQWTLAAARAEGWHMPLATRSFAWLAVLAISALSATLAYYIFRQPVLLSRQIAERTAELNEANESLQTEIYQHWQTELQLRENERRLEQRVAERTQALAEANASLQREKEQQQILIDKLADTASELMQSRMLVAVGQLAAGVAHEINNPMAFVASNVGALKGYAEALADYLGRYRTIVAPWVAGNAELEEELRLLEMETGVADLAADLPDLVRDTQGGILRIKHIVQNLKEFSFVDQSAWQRADLNRCLEATLGVLEAELGEDISVVLERGTLPPVECNAPQLSQVFSNLLRNAIQAIAGKGEIRVTTRTVDERVEVEIADSGHGIAAENLSRVFEPFFTTRPVGQGAGLGLSVAYHLVKRHGGTITAASPPGSGAVFVVSLPVSRMPDATVA